MARCIPSLAASQVTVIAAPRRGPNRERRGLRGARPWPTLGVFIRRCDLRPIEPGEGAGGTRGFRGRDGPCIGAAMRDAPPSALPFRKMHGLGNDFVVLDRRGATDGPVPADLARAMGDRRRGVGFDQLAVIEGDPEADARLTFLNADGSEAGACGNATRCVARLLMDEAGAATVTIRRRRARPSRRRRRRRAGCKCGSFVLLLKRSPGKVRALTINLPQVADGSAAQKFEGQPPQRRHLAAVGQRAGGGGDVAAVAD